MVGLAESPATTPAQEQLAAAEAVDAEAQERQPSLSEDLLLAERFLIQMEARKALRKTRA